MAAILSAILDFEKGKRVCLHPVDSVTRWYELIMVWLLE